MPSSANFWIGLDVHEDSVATAVFRNRDPEPLHVDRMPYDLRKLRRYFQRLQAEGTFQGFRTGAVHTLTGSASAKLEILLTSTPTVAPVSPERP